LGKRKGKNWKMPTFAIGRIWKKHRKIISGIRKTDIFEFCSMICEIARHPSIVDSQGWNRLCLRQNVNFRHNVLGCDVEYYWEVSDLKIFECLRRVYCMWAYCLKWLYSSLIEIIDNLKNLHFGLSNALKWNQLFWFGFPLKKARHST
jgi:hypothetical protein